MVTTSPVSSRTMTRIFPRWTRQALLWAATATLVSCQRDPASATAEPGLPLPGLSEQQLAEFRAGRGLFEKVFSPDEGLGPFFNENQCSACHTVPATGGTTGFERIVKATRFDEVAGCDLLKREGGENVRTRATPRLQAHGIDREQIPSGATEVGRFVAPFLFGLGLIEAIPERSILSRADPDDADGDGISGRAGTTPEGRVARFGRKADVATVEDFVESALRLEMGLTTRDLPNDDSSALTTVADVDTASDPEVPQSAVQLLAAFVRFLGAPAPGQPRSGAHRDTIALGRSLFQALRCSACHTPSMRTGRHAVRALDRRTVTLYSDLLLHDMGPKLANICGPTASPTEIRTGMLMGLRHRDRFLHDGRTSDLRDAILTHGGEAQRSRDAFDRLPWGRQEILLKFLRSL